MRSALLKRVSLTLMLLFAVGGATSLPARTHKKDIAIQLYSVRDLIDARMKSGETCRPILDELAGMGYTAVETADYRNGLFYGQTPADFRRDVEAAGMRVLSSHCTRTLSREELETGDFSQALKWWDECIAAHKAAGMDYIVTPYMNVQTVGELDVYCRYYNEVGRRCNAAGLRYGYHNHSHELRKLDDNTVMLDYMLEHTNPECVFFEMDVYWMMIGKASPVDYFHRYPGRFTVLHIKDQREIGQSGMVGFDAIFGNISEAGARHIVVEVERYSYDDVMRSVRESMEYLRRAPFVRASYSK